MKTTEHWLDLYGESHQNKTNKLIHRICVPLIMFSLIGLLSNIKIFQNFDCSYLLFIVASMFYISLGIKVFLMMQILVLPMLLIVHLLKMESSFLYVYLSIFIVAWIGQFIGHKIEGKKPSFFQDIQFLLIGPIWILPKSLHRYLIS